MSECLPTEWHHSSSSRHESEWDPEECFLLADVFRLVLLLSDAVSVSLRSSSVFVFTPASSAFTTKTNNKRSQLISLLTQRGSHESCCLRFTVTRCSSQPAPRPPAGRRLAVWLSLWIITEQILLPVNWFIVWALVKTRVENVRLR